MNPQKIEQGIANYLNGALTAARSEYEFAPSFEGSDQLQISSLPAPPLSAGDVIHFTSTGTLPGGLQTFRRYEILEMISDQLITIVDPETGGELFTEDLGSGVHSLELGTSAPVRGSVDPTDKPESGGIVVVLCDALDQVVAPLWQADVRIQVQQFALHDPAGAGLDRSDIEAALDEALRPENAAALAAAILAEAGDTSAEGGFVHLNRWSRVEDESEQRWATEKTIRLSIEEIPGDEIPDFVSFSTFPDEGSLESAFPAASNDGRFALIEVLGVPVVFAAAASAWA